MHVVSGARQSLGSGMNYLVNEAAEAAFSFERALYQNLSSFPSHS